MKRTIAIQVNAVQGGGRPRAQEFEPLYKQIIQDFRNKFGFWPVAGDRIKMPSHELLDANKFELYLHVTDRYTYPSDEVPLLVFQVDTYTMELDDEDEEESEADREHDEEEHGFDYQNNPGSDD